MPANKKEIKINPDLFVPAGARRYNARRTAKAASQGRSLKAGSIKKALLRKIKSKGGAADTPGPNKEPDIYSDDVLSKSLQYLDDISRKRGNFSTAPNQIYVDLGMPPEVQATPPAGGADTTRISSAGAIVAPPPPYGCLKGGNKSTYRQWKQTQKNSKPFGQPQPGGYMETIQIIPDVARPPPAPTDNAERKEKLRKAQNLHKSRQVVEKQYATFGKQKGKNKTARKISVLIKDNKTLKKIEHEKNMLDKHEIAKVRTYLRNRGLLKVGSSAPDDILRELYRNAFLAGDIHNKSTDVLMHNYMANEE